MKPHAMPLVRNLSILGLGLIGGSVALGARARGLAARIVGWNRNPSVTAAAASSGAIDRAAPSPEEAVRGADLVVVAVPVLATPPLALRAREAAPAAAVLTDVGSTKESVVTALDAAPPGGPAFVGGHPIAGREDSGLAAARADLFDGTLFVMTPTELTDPAAAQLVESFWSGLGSRVRRLPPTEHDRLFALVSHLPHVAAYALVGAIAAGLGDPRLVGDLAGGGFRDSTRIAASDPVMWRDICLDNRAQLLRALDLLSGELSFVREALAGGDGEALQRIFERARTFKRTT